MKQKEGVANIPQENILGTEKIGKLLALFAVPGILSMLVNSVYNIVDQIFIGQGVGYLGNGATNVIFPMTILALAFALMVGDGAGSYMSLMLGKKREEDAAKGVAAGLAGLVIVGFTLVALYLLFMESLCRLFGATDAILPYALDYGYIICLGLPFSCIAAGFSSVIRSDGNPKWNMVGLMTGCLINIVLDPTFIFVCHMGVKGAAMATVLGQFANAVISLLYLPRMKTVKLSKATFSGWRKTLPTVVSLGASSFISQFVMVISIAVQNNVLVRYGALSEYGAEIPMTALGVTMKIFSILMAVMIGLSTGAQPIFGYNYGAGKYDRVKAAFRYTIAISVGAMSAAWIAFQLVPEPLVSIFGTQSEMYTRFSVRCLRVFLMAIPLAAVHVMSGNFFQSVGKPVQASVISLSKQFIFMIPMTLILPRFMGVEGVLWAGCFADVLAFLLCLLLYKLYWKSLFAETAAPVSRPAVSVGDGVGFLGDGQVADANAPNVIITIGRSYASPGSAVGKAIAEELHIPYYDGEILQRTAENSGLSMRYLQRAKENAGAYRLIYNIAPLRDVSADVMQDLRAKANAAQNEIILQAAQGPCVIVGRRADQILRNRPNVVRVFITAELADRVSAVSASEGLNAEEAKARVEDIDRHRASYYGELNGKAWGHADNYDLCLNTSIMGEEGAVYMIKNAVEGKLIHMKKVTA